MPRTALPSWKAAVLLARPWQWYKNLVVAVPLVFSGHLLRLGEAAAVLQAMAGFVLLSAACYALNDAVDAPADRRDPRKAGRPVASGAIRPGAALALAAAKAAAGLALLLPLGLLVLATGAAYLALQAIYSVATKRLAIVDALSIGVGFVLRALAGALAIGVPSTDWLLVCTFLFAFYLALAKRRHERIRSGDAAALSRPAHTAYSLPFLEQSMQVATTLLLAAYTLYTVFAATKWMMVSLPFAFYGILRHNQLVLASDLEEGSLIFRDVPTLVNAALWLAAVLVVLSGLPEQAASWLRGWRPM